MERRSTYTSIKTRSLLLCNGIVVNLTLISIDHPLFSSTFLLFFIFFFIRSGGFFNDLARLRCMELQLCSTCCYKEEEDSEQQMTKSEIRKELNEKNQTEKNQK